MKGFKVAFLSVFIVSSLGLIYSDSVINPAKDAPLVKLDGRSINKGICEISTSYGLQAYEEKKETDLSLEDFITLTIYGLKQSEELKDLNYKEQEIFINFIFDAYKYVYEEEGLTDDNISERLVDNCESNKTAALKKINDRYIMCQLRGGFYENLSKHRYNDEDIIMVKSIYAGLLRKNPEKYKAISLVLDYIYDYEDFKTPSFLGKSVYEECLVE